MNCTYTLVHGRQSSKNRGDYGLIELLVCFEDKKKSYLSTKTYVKYSDWNKRLRSIKPESAEFAYAQKRVDDFVQKIKGLEHITPNFSPDTLRDRHRAVNESDLSAGTLNLAIRRVIDQSTRKAQGTIDNYNQTLAKLNEYDPSINLSLLAQSPISVVHGFDKFLFIKGLAPTTIDKLHSICRTLFSVVHSIYFSGQNYVDPYDGWDFSANTKDNVFLTDKDITLLENHDVYPFGSEECYVRDAFLLAYYTGVRYSDMDKLIHDNITTINGTDTFMFYPKKSTVFNKKPKKAIVPITDKVRRIMDKYEFCFLIPDDYTMRKHIRTICFEAGINYEFKYIKYEGIKTSHVTARSQKPIVTGKQ